MSRSMSIEEWEEEINKLSECQSNHLAYCIRDLMTWKPFRTEFRDSGLWPLQTLLMAQGREKSREKEGKNAV